MKKAKRIIALSVTTALTALATTFSMSVSAFATTDAGAAQGSIWPTLLMWGVVIVVFYFILIRPNSKKKKQEQALRENLEVGNEITTIGGIVGRIVSIKSDTDSLIIETSADRTRMQIKTWAISTVDTEKDAPEKGKDEKDGEKKSFFSRFKKKDEE